MNLLGLILLLFLGELGDENEMDEIQRINEARASYFSSQRTNDDNQEEEEIHHL